MPNSIYNQRYASIIAPIHSPPEGFERTTELFYFLDRPCDLETFGVGAPSGLLLYLEGDSPIHPPTSIYPRLVGRFYCLPRELRKVFVDDAYTEWTEKVCEYRDQHLLHGTFRRTVTLKDAAACYPIGFTDWLLFTLNDEISNLEKQVLLLYGDESSG